MAILGIDKGMPKSVEVVVGKLGDMGSVRWAL